MVDAAGALRLDCDVHASYAHDDHAIHWHYAFADKWLKVNLTTSMER